jgi:hypothetical protein
MTRDLPQASSLAKVRELVAAIASGHGSSLREAGAAVGLSPRHAQYYALAAIITLELVSRGERLAPTPLGEALLRTRPGSQEERAIFRSAIEKSVAITSIAPDLLDEDGPSAEALTQRLVHADLSPATAERRASTLLSWRRYALERQTDLPLE